MSLDPSELLPRMTTAGVHHRAGRLHKPHSSENCLSHPQPRAASASSLHTPPSSRPELAGLRVDEDSWFLVSWACWWLSLRSLEGEPRTWLSWSGALTVGSAIEPRSQWSSKSHLQEENWCRKAEKQRWAPRRFPERMLLTASAPAPHSRTPRTPAPLPARGRQVITSCPPNKLHFLSSASWSPSVLLGAKRFLSLKSYYLSWLLQES